MTISGKEQKTIIVSHYYGHLILYPFLTPELLDVLEDAYLSGQKEVNIPLPEYERLIDKYFETLKN